MRWSTMAVVSAGAVAATLLLASGTADAHPGGPQYSYDRFQSPSGNIACMITGGTDVRCDVHDFAFTPPARPAGGCGASGYGHTVTMSVGSAAQFTCAGDTVADSSLPVLDYETTTGVGQVECYSTTDYMYCSAGSHYFRLSRDTYALQ
ncbi:hypothetical protein KO481_22770 [Nocardia sp. NEAU-G5]|uniref:Ig-like domain-containing protein n=1 Tax=Nocardia albiluteola TaxID=2842303 RepID=A0ABS6B275_9NOCA|nr:hypothetical protein [Nocardia albiluteola]MBU3064344.1 hypothetical protein [Nocardia albiluteola]